MVTIDNKLRSSKCQYSFQKIEVYRKMSTFRDKVVEGLWVYCVDLSGKIHSDFCYLLCLIWKEVNFSVPPCLDLSNKDNIPGTSKVDYSIDVGLAGCKLAVMKLLIMVVVITMMSRVITRMTIMVVVMIVIEMMVMIMVMIKMVTVLWNKIKYIKKS